MEQKFRPSPLVIKDIKVEYILTTLTNTSGELTYDVEEKKGLLVR